MPLPDHPAAAPDGVEAWLDRQQHQDLLRFITCGSVDDGKSTLIGRLLVDAQRVFEDQLAAVVADSRKWGTQGDAVDLALLVDGLAAEREQGITIDVAYRHFSSEHRKFIVADTPGHVQYTRNMVTGASTAELAVVLVDARKGLLEQTRRHSHLVGLLGIRQVLLAVNKMDLVDHAEPVFRHIVEQYHAFAAQPGRLQVMPIPISALHGDNVVTPSQRMPWYRGPTVMQHLDRVEVGAGRPQGAALRMPVQWVNRPNADFRGVAGTITSGAVRPGDRIRVQPSGHESTVARIVTADGDLPQAVAGQAVTLTLGDELDVSRGDLISASLHPAEVADQFEATLVWMDTAPMLPGRGYLFKLATSTAGASVTACKYKRQVNTLEQLAATRLELNDIGVVTLALDRPLAFDAYRSDRVLGGFILVDRSSHHTVAAGMLHFALRRAHNIHLQPTDVDKAARASIKGQRPAVVWLTGLSGAGKSTIANLVEQRLHAMGLHSYLLDGDNLRHGLNRDLGFTAEDRVENVRRMAEVARLMVDAGLIVIAAVISPFRAERRMARALVDRAEFVEVFVHAPLAVAEARDVKGLYAKARRGELRNFTGIDSPYEAPESPELCVDTSVCSADAAAEQVIGTLRARGLIP